MPLDPNAPLVYLLKAPFQLSIGGVVRAGFMKCSELGDETDVVEIREGANPYPITQPGNSKIKEVTLERGMVAEDFDLWGWREQVANSRTQRGVVEFQFKKDIDLTQFNNARVARNKWRMKRCWPKEYAAGDLDTSASEVQIERVVLVVEALERIAL